MTWGFGPWTPGKGRRKEESPPGCLLAPHRLCGSNVPTHTSCAHNTQAFSNGGLWYLRVFSSHFYTKTSLKLVVGLLSASGNASPLYYMLKMKHNQQCAVSEGHSIPSQVSISRRCGKPLHQVSQLARRHKGLNSLKL